MTALHPTYSHSPVGSVVALARALGVAESHLRYVVSRRNEFVRANTPEKKKNGGIRQTFTFLDPLDDIQKRILKTFLKRVTYPEYLKGSIQGRDYLADASAHADAVTIIQEDVTDFFPSTSREIVLGIWKGVFHFPDTVADVLTDLTTLDGCIPQGARTSSYLANLTFWRKEPSIVAMLKLQEIRYTRYVDDIVVSASRKLESSVKSEIIAQVYALLKSHGFKPSRGKHAIMSQGRKSLEKKPRGMYVHGLKVQNGRVLYDKPRRRVIRAEADQFKKSMTKGDIVGVDAAKRFDSIHGKILAMGILHPREANDLLALIEPFKEMVDPYRTKNQRPSGKHKARKSTTKMAT